MRKEEIREQVIEIIEENGIVIEENDKFAEIDSLQLVSCILMLEENFKIAFPDDFLGVENFLDVNSICYVIEELI